LYVLGFKLLVFPIIFYRTLTSSQNPRTVLSLLLALFGLVVR
jgi:hypothetical protein